VLAKASEGKPAEKDAEGKGCKPPTGKDAAPLNGKAPEEASPKNGTSPQSLPAEAGGELSLEQDVQLQKAVELLKSWKIFKELKSS
jgi:carboxyl-terminal processing protease